LDRVPYTLLEVVNRIHRRLFLLNDKIEHINRELRLVTAELSNHRSIDEDARRDAAVGNYIDREEAGRTAGDVRRFEKTAFYLKVRRAKLIKARDRLLDRLPD
jgi:hypothetical protein